MQSYLLLLILVAPFIAAAVIALQKTQSLWSSVFVVLGAIVGALLIALSGVCWLQVLHRNWMESQAIGFIFVPILLPICIYTGAVAGSSLVAILIRHPGSHFASPVFQMIAISFTIVLSGLIPSTLVTLSSLSDLANNVGQELNLFTFVVVPFFVMCAGVASAWLASELAYLLVANLGAIKLGISA